MRYEASSDSISGFYILSGCCGKGQVQEIKKKGTFIQGIQALPQYGITVRW